VFGQQDRVYRTGQHRRLDRDRPHGRRHPLTLLSLASSELPPTILVDRTVDRIHPRHVSANITNEGSEPVRGPVESQYADNTSVELVVDNGENSTFEITVTGDAEFTVGDVQALFFELAR